MRGKLRSYRLIEWALLIFSVTQATQLESTWVAGNARDGRHSPAAVLGSEAQLSSKAIQASGAVRARRLQSVLSGKKAHPKQLKITLNSQYAKLAPGKEALRRVGRAAWRVEAPAPLREPRPRKLPGGRRAGKVEGSPTLANYTFDDESLQRMCSDSSRAIKIRRFPLSLPLGRDPQHMFVTKANFESDKTWMQYMSSIERYLPEFTREFFGEKRLYESCAIVGNSGNLKRATWGQEIDAHEAVFRFNRGQTKGFEKWVGSRTDFRILNRAESRIYAQNGIRADREEIVRKKLLVRKRVVKEITPMSHNSTIVLSRMLPNETAHDLEGIHMWAMVRRLTGVKLTMLDHFVFKYAKTTLNEFRKCWALRKGSDPETHGQFNSPSSGLLITMAAIHLCKEVSIYGIGETTMKGSPYQYFMNLNNRSFGRPNTRAHNFPLEARWLRLMAQEGLIRKCEYGSCWTGASSTTQQQQ